MVDSVLTFGAARKIPLIIVEGGRVTVSAHTFPRPTSVMSKNLEGLKLEPDA
jgi:hypothetical protein